MIEEELKLSNVIKDFFKDRKRIIYNRDNSQEYLVRYYLFLKDRKNFPFNITMHKVMMSDEPILHLSLIHI